MSETANSLPRLLLVSEATLDEKATGLNRTLFNLLADYPMDRFMLYAPAERLHTSPPAPPFGQQVAAFSKQFSLSWRNRLGAKLSPVLDLLNLQMIDLLPLPDAETIISFDPEIILICPDGPMGLVMGYKTAQTLKRPFLVYLMDDWVATAHQRWFSGSTQAYCQRLLRDAEGWMIISSQLEQSLIDRYAIKPQRSLVVHNPVNLSNKEVPDFQPHQQQTFRIAYAGSIWTMHYDAIALIAQAISELQTAGHSIELVLYTQEGFWSFYCAEWETWRVVYGGFLPYQAVNQHLQQADLLLIASSFLPRYANITRSSVQTKVTDYMATGRPILSYGPSYAACNAFVKQWSCGITCETNDLEEVKVFLLNQIQNREANQIYARTAYKVLQQHFETRKIREMLLYFIQHSVCKNIKEEKLNHA
jgi:glycosyltransferase involved in cell wall biosynthesis